MKIGIFPGTFDPITTGHIEIIRRASKIVDLLIVGVASSTKKNTLFTTDERYEMAKNEVFKIDENIITESFSGLLVDFIFKKNASIIIRGLRAVSDFEYEYQMSLVNYHLSDGKIETIFIPASESAQFISSSFVRDIAKLDGNVGKFVSEEVEKKLKIKLKNEN